MSEQSSSHHVRDLQICLENIKELSKNLGTPHDSSEGEKYQKLFDTYKRISNLKHSSIDLKVFQNDEFIVLYRELLISKNIQISLQARKYLKFLLRLNPKITKRYCELNVPVLVSRIIESYLSTHSNLKELAKFLKFLKEWIKHSPANFPSVFVLSLKSVSQNSHPSGKKLKKFAIEILNILVICNFNQFAFFNCFEILIKAVITKEIEEPRLIESICQTLVEEVMDDVTARNLLVNSGELGQIFTLFSAPLPNAYLADKYKTLVNKENDDFIERSSLAVEFLLKVLRKPVGIFFFIQNVEYFQSMVMSLKSVSVSHERKAIVLRFIEDSLVPKVEKELEYLYALQLKMFIDCGLFSALQELAIVDDFEDKAKDLLCLLGKACARMIPLGSKPNSDFLFEIISKSTKSDSSQNYTDPLEKELYNSLKHLYTENFEEERKLDRQEQDNAIMMSKIKTLFDNQCREEGISATLTIEDRRRNPFINACEGLYLNLKTSFRDTRIKKTPIWSFLLASTDFNNKFDPLTLLDSLPDDHTKWNLEMLKELFDTLISSSSLTNERKVKPLFVKFIRFFVNEEFLHLQWSPDIFPYITASYKFFELVLQHHEFAMSLLKGNISQNPFNPFQSFMKKLKNLLSESKHLLAGSYLKIPINHSEMYNKIDSPVRIRHRILSFKKNEDLMFISPATPRQKTQTADFADFNVTLIREYFGLIAYFSFFKTGRALLRDVKLYELLAKMIKKSGKYNHIISIFLLGFNYDSEDCLGFLRKCIEEGSEHLVKLSLNVLEFLIDSERFEKATPFAELLVNKLSKPSSEIQKAIIRVLIQIILQTDHDMAILLLMQRNFLMSSPSLIQAFMKKPRCVPMLIDSKIIDELFTRYTSSNPQFNYFDQSMKTAPSEFRGNEVISKENFEFIYNHSPHYLADYFYDSGCYIAALLRYPWGLRAKLYHEDTPLNIVLNSQATFNSELRAIEIVGTIIKDVGDAKEISDGFKDSDQSWQISVSLFIGCCLVNENLEMCEDDSPFRGEKCTRDRLTETGSILRATVDGIDYIFRRNKRKPGYIVLDKIMLYINLDKNGQAPSPSEDNFFDLMTQTKPGARYLREQGIISQMLTRSCHCDNYEEKMWNLFCLGFVAQNEEGAALLNEYRSQITDLFCRCVNESKYLSIKTEIYRVANMLAKTAIGRSILIENNWQVYKMSGRLIADREAPFIAVYKDEKLDTEDNDQHNLGYRTFKDQKWRIFNEVTINVESYYKEMGLKEHSFILGLQEMLAGKSKVEIRSIVRESKNPVPLFYYLSALLNSTQWHNSGVRSYLWSLLSEFFKIEGFLQQLDSGSELFTNFVQEA